jgi:aromatic ring-opening dioxygenase catalytic subunit (LigB family)
MEAMPGDRFYDISKGSETFKSLERLPKQLGAEKPTAIVIVTAHWERYPIFSISTSYYFTTPQIHSPNTLPKYTPQIHSPTTHATPIAPTPLIIPYNTHILSELVPHPLTRTLF